MPLLLRQRAAGLSERMDDPHCELDKLRATYRNFRTVNRLVAGWHRVYRRHIRPLEPRSLLDVGCGGGDVLRLLGAWLAQDGIEARLVGIDPDPRALEFARAQPGSVTFVQTTSTDVAAAGERFDLVLSNHLLHHLSRGELLELCRDSAQLACKGVIHNDIRRGDLAFLGFTLSAPFFRGSFITPDGLRSIRRSYTRAELERLAPPGWRVEGVAPYRNLLLYTP